MRKDILSVENITMQFGGVVAVDDLNLESDQMDQLYDSLEALNIDIGTEEDLLPELPDDEPAAEEIADVEIMLEQMMMLFCCADDVRDWRRRKVARLKKRLDGDSDA